ncbi:uncharacterized protein LOC143432105 [Xylocopa sonorina]|uniref:uncharacterized protein LOC143428901 n=1 Tax=Xylocopa sonorina TaxID=1818115 RepID=UPI00403AF94A
MVKSRKYAFAALALFALLQRFAESSEVFNYLYFFLLNQIAIYGASSKHVHFKILVPDVLNHHVHTRLVLVHLHKPTLKMPKTQSKSVHHSNWSSWSYGRHRDYKYKDDIESELDHEDHRIDQKKKQHAKDQLENEKKRRDKHFPKYDYHKDSYQPPSYVEDNNLEQKNHKQRGFSYVVQGNVKNLPPNTENISYNYEEGYRKGLETESGHIRADQMHKFHDHHEEEGEVESGGFKENFETKTDAGRYLLDDVDYENTRDKRRRTWSKMYEDS